MEKRYSKIDKAIPSVAEFFNRKDLDNAVWPGMTVRISAEILDAMRQVRKVHSQGLLSKWDYPIQFAGVYTKDMLDTADYELDANPIFVIHGVVKLDVSAVMANVLYCNSDDLGFYASISPVASNIEARTKKHYMGRIRIPVEFLEIVDFSTEERVLTPGVDFDASIWEIDQHKRNIRRQEFEAYDKTVEGFSNMPTACVGLAIENDVDMLSKVRGLRRASDGMINVSKVRRLLTAENAYEKYLVPENFILEQFPEFSMTINHEELAEYFSRDPQ